MTPGSVPGQIGPPPTAAAPPGPVGGHLVVKTRVFDGILTGLASATIGGLVWWAIAANTQQSWWPYLSVIVGVVVGFGVLVGARRGGLAAAIIAVVLSSAAVLVAVYFIDRSFAITAIEDAGRTIDVPLWQGRSEAVDVITNYIDYTPKDAAAWLLAPLVALVITARPGARSIVG